MEYFPKLYKYIQILEVIKLLLLIVVSSSFLFPTLPDTLM